MIHRILLLLVMVARAYAGNTGAGFVGSPDSGCATCGSAAQNFAGVNVSIDAGLGKYGAIGGSFLITGADPLSNIDWQNALRFSGWTDSTRGTEVLWDTSDKLAQVVTHESFSVVSRGSTYEFKIDVYILAAKGAFNGSLYAVTSPAANLIATWTFENPDASATVFNRLRITQSRPNQTDQVWLYSYSSATKFWTLTMPVAGFEQRFSQSVVGTDRTEKIQLLRDGEIESESLRTFRTFAWGVGLISSTVGSGAAAKTDQTFYFANGGGYPASSDRPPVEYVQRWDGSWTATTGYDGQGRPLGRIVAVDTTYPSPASSGRSWAYSYAPVDLSDDGSILPDVPRQETESYKGTPISRIYRIFSPGKSQEIRCESPTDLHTAPGRLVTTKTYFTSGDRAGELKSVENPDGRMTFYSYETTATYRQVTQTTGEANSSIDPLANRTRIINGQRTITRTGSHGEPIFSSTEVIVNDAVGPLISKTQAVDWDSNWRVKKTTFIDENNKNQPPTFAFPSESTTYDCCGVQTTTDRLGVMTTYLYDDLRRQRGTLREGITTKADLDAVGRSVLNKRQAAGVPDIILGQSTFDSAGRLKNSINQFSGTTIYSESFEPNGFLTRTTQNPDGGTVAQTYDREGQLRKQTGTATTSFRMEYGTESTTDESGTHVWYFSRRIRLNSNGTDSAETVKTYTDSFGRNVKIVLASGAYSLSLFNAKGQRVQSIDPDKVKTVYQYNNLGETEVVSVGGTVAANGTIDLSGQHRARRTLNDFTVLTTPWPSLTVSRSRTYEYGLSDATPLLVGETWSTLDGLQTWSTSFGLTSRTMTTINPVTSTQTTTHYSPDGSYVVAVSVKGLTASDTRYSSSGVQIRRQTYTYDVFGRRKTSVDSRNGTTTYNYNSADAVEWVLSPSPGNGDPAQLVQNSYDTSGRLKTTTLADGTTVTREYFPTGALKKNSGSRTYPVEYTYDTAGRMATMSTWTDATTGIGLAVTTWLYNNNGQLEFKKYNDTSQVQYTYTAAGRQKTRLWARGVTTTYFYDFEEPVATRIRQVGDLYRVVYSDQTPEVTYATDRRGRRTGLSQKSGGGAVIAATSLNVRQDGLLNGENHTTGPLAYLETVYGYDQYLRNEKLTVKKSGNEIDATTYGYDNASRLQTVTDGVNNTTYGYIPNSDLVGTISSRQGTKPQITTVRSYDFLGRLLDTKTQSSEGGNPTLGSGYVYNTGNQRVTQKLGDGSYWVYEYDALGQVISGKHYWSDGSLVVGQQMEYVFDTIGNRRKARTGGDANGANLREQTITPNSLNQVVSRANHRYVEVQGVARTTDTVLVNSVTAWRQGEYFRRELGPIAGVGALWQPVTLQLNIGAPWLTKSIFLPPAVETTPTLTSDADGNLTADGQWIYVWDAENRLTEVRSVAPTLAPTSLSRRVTYRYDGTGRLMERADYGWISTGPSTGSWNTTANILTRYLCNGWSCIAEFGTTANVLQRTYQWGLDLSGTRGGAGGVGGLVAIKSVANGAHFPGYDGNGNVIGLYNADDGLSSARYDYDPFGVLLRITGGLIATENPWRFSTKRTDSATDLIHYEYRVYDSKAGRWLSRDPLNESGGKNLHCFVGNSPQNWFDVDGRYQSGGHYYTVFIAGVIAGMSPDAASELAFFAQLPDQLLALTAFDYDVPGMLAIINQLTKNGEFSAPRHANIQKYIHVLNGGDAIKARLCLSKLLLSDTSLKTWEKGFVLHALGDSYAHSYVETTFIPNTGYYSLGGFTYQQSLLYPVGRGHGLQGIAPDLAARRIGLYTDYLVNTIEVLSGRSINESQLSEVQNIRDGLQNLVKLNVSDAELSKLEVAYFRNEAGRRRLAGQFRPEEYPSALHSGVFHDLVFGSGQVGFQFGLPTDDELEKLFGKIRCACPQFR